MQNQAYDIGNCRDDCGNAKDNPHHTVIHNLNLHIRLPLCVTERNLQNLAGNHLAQVGHIGCADELKLDSTHTGKPKLQFAVKIERTCGFHGESLNLAIGKRSEVSLFAGDTLFCGSCG